MPDEKQDKSEAQHKKFAKAARELGCDENEEAVDELMKRVASSPPPRKNENQKQGKGESPLSKPKKISYNKPVKQGS